MNRREWERKQRRASREEWKRLFLGFGLLIFCFSALVLLQAALNDRAGTAKVPIICMFLLSGLFLLVAIVMHFGTPPDEQPPASPITVKEKIQDAYDDVKYRRRDAEERRRKKVLGRLVPIMLALIGIAALFAFVFHSSAGFYVFIGLAAVLGFMGQIYYFRPWAEMIDDKLPEGTDPADDERYAVAREKLFNLLRNLPGISSGLADNFIKWAENGSRRFRDDPHRVATFAAKFAADHNFREDEAQAVLEMLLARVRRPPDVQWQADTHIDVIMTPKGTVLVTWRPAIPEVEKSLRVAGEKAKQPILQTMTQIMQANPDTDLVKKALTFGVEVIEVERAWTQENDTLSLAKNAAARSTSLMQIAVEEAQFMAKHNLRKGTREYEDVEAIFEEARHAIMAPNRV